MSVRLNCLSQDELFALFNNLNPSVVIKIDQERTAKPLERSSRFGCKFAQ